MNGLLNSINGFSFISFEQIVICKCLCNGFVVQLNGDRFLSREKKHIIDIKGLLIFAELMQRQTFIIIHTKMRMYPHPTPFFRGLRKAFLKMHKNSLVC